MSKRKIGLFVMSYGTPEGLDQVEAYYTHIRRGNPPSLEQLQKLTDRYGAIGGMFPLRKNTNSQVEALETELNQAYPEYEFIGYQGLKHAHPLIEEGIQQMAQDGLKEAVGVVLAPHYSIMSIGGYIKRAQEAANELGIKISFVHQYHLHPLLIEALTERVERALQHFDEGSRDKVRVIFSAHSLPSRILEMGDPYPEQLLETSKAICNKLGISNWQFAWQSAGQTATPWLGPDIMEVLRDIHHQEQVDKVLISPIGFVSDHLEVLYDIDIECQSVARELGIHLERTESLNTEPKYIKTLADVVYSKLEEK
jgi:ferrochelatase